MRNGINGENTILSVNGLSKSFGNEKVLKDVSLSVDRGEIISLIGRSGCGKTTFLRCINCLAILNEGTIHVNGIEISSADFKGAKIGDDFKSADTRSHNLKDSLQFISDDKIKRKVFAIRNTVGFLFQNLNLFPHLSVIENVLLPLEKVLKMNRDEAVARAEELLGKVDMKNFAQRSPHKISGGQAQRVAIARALAVNPDIMLYDEPTSALDPELVQEFIEIMKQLKSEGMTQILVTHSLPLSRKVSERVAYMDKGEIVESGSPGQIFDSPENAKTKEYISKILLN